MARPIQFHELPFHFCAVFKFGALTPSERKKILVKFKFCNGASQHISSMNIASVCICIGALHAILNLTRRT